MNDILSKVTPHTRGIIWLYQGRPQADSKVYKAMDYLLNGLLTVSLETNSELTSRVLMSTNFHFPLHVFMTSKFNVPEYDSYLKLLKKDLTPESKVLVLDEIDAFATIQSKTPQDLKSLLHHYK